MMRERAEAVGAVLSVASQPGHGTEIALRWTEAPEQEAI
jgi:signal transduction histidine kinase